jgi:RNA polymerase-binding transcription factor DksA
MALVLVGREEPEDRTMDAKNIGNSRQRLSTEYQNLVQAINRTRLATKDLAIENTEDEYDLATISQNRELLYDLYESDLQRLRYIQEALKTIDTEHISSRLVLAGMDEPETEP